MGSYKTLSVDRPEPAIVVARLDRPERLNAITFEMFDEFVRLQREVESDAAARVVVLTGTGRAFCAGLDLDAAGTLPGCRLRRCWRERSPGPGPSPASGT